MVQWQRLYLIKWLQTQGIFSILGELLSRFQFRWCLCDHIGELIQETEGIQVLIVSTYGNKLSKVSLYANKLVYIILYYIGTESKLKTKEEL